MIKYPSALDDSLSIPIATDNVSPVKASFVNTLRDAILAIEAELGIDPSREYGTVRARLDAMTTGGGGSGVIEILENGSVVSSNVTSIDFSGNVTVTIPQPLRVKVEVTGGQATQVQETIAVTLDGQTSFTLSQTPFQSSAVLMFVNGIKQQISIDYTVALNIVNYLGASIPLKTTDKVEFWYLVDTTGLSGGGGGGSDPGKIRVYRGTSNFAGSGVGSPQTVTWNEVSTEVTTEDASSPTTQRISPDSEGHFLCSGQLTIQPTVDAVSGLTIDVIKNGVTTVHTVTDYGSVWGSGISRSFSWAFPIDLDGGDTLEVRWTHSGSGSSATTLIFGDNLSWFAISRF